jgi:hypothetical protein
VGAETVWPVKSLSVTITLTQTKINDVEGFQTRLATEKQIIWFEVTMNITVVVNELDAIENLNT